MPSLAAWIPALLSLIFIMMALNCFFWVAIYRLNTKLAAAISRRLKEANAAMQELSDLTSLLHYIMMEAQKKNSVIEEQNAFIEEKGAVIEEKVAIIEKKNAILEEKNALIGTKKSIISQQQLQITNLTQRLRKGGTRAQTTQGEIQHLKSMLEKATAGSRKAAATETFEINQNVAEIDNLAMASQLIKDLQASLAAAGREAHEWRTEAYIAIVRKKPPSQRGLSLFGMDPRNFMPRVPVMQAYNSSYSLVGPAGAPSFTTSAPPYPLPKPAPKLSPGPNGYEEIRWSEKIVQGKEER